jgi:hypothetical protein
MNEMDKKLMRSFLIRDKGFLKELYIGVESSKNKRILYFAEDGQLNTLIKYLHFLANGEIEIKKSIFEIIEKSNKLKVITKKVESSQSMENLVKGLRSQKLLFLNQLTDIYSALLYPLFNEN